MAKYSANEDDSAALKETVSAIRKVLETNTNASVDEIMRLLKWTDNGANRFIISMALKAIGK